MKDTRHPAGTAVVAAGGGVDDAGLFDGLTEIVRLEVEPARRFVREAAEEYRKCLASRDAEGVPRHLPRASALLFGRLHDTEIVISDVEFVSNVRDRDERVIAEFEGTIAPRFGDVYRNPGRGFWCDEEGVLEAVKRHAADGLELMGSAHSHPNWHEIGPPHERRQQLSESPTRMDEYLFRQACWPVNVIWYIRSTGGEMMHHIAAWRPRSAGCERLKIQLPPAIHHEYHVESVNLHTPPAGCGSPAR